jgi:urea transport system substrate-binding protein
MALSSELEPSSHEPSSPAAENPPPREAPGETHAHPGHTDSGAPKQLPQGGGGLGPRLGRYEIRHLLGTGGMGVVYKAHDALIERDVAIKILPQEFARDQTSLERFLSEARAAGKFIHPNAVAIYEVGQQDDTYFLVMECVPGGSVGDALDKTPGGLGAAEATRIAADACRGLAAAHAVGLVHRDIKPANLLRAADGSVKIADFGLAKPVFGTIGQLTQAGQILGTPYYMSPEQCSSDGLDHRSDIYSLGATYYALLTGAEPYRNAGTIVQVMFAHCNGEIPDPRKLRPELPEECSQIIARAMAKDPDDRYQTAGEMLADLEILADKLSGGPRSSISLAAAQSRKPTSRARAGGAVAALAAVVGIGSYFLGRDTVGPVDRAPLVVPAAVATPSGLPIRVGVLHSLTGTMAESESPVVEATLLAIEELNHAGGLLGRPIEPIVRDGRSDPQVFAAEARNLIVD